MGTLIGQGISTEQHSDGRLPDTSQPTLEGLRVDSHSDGVYFQPLHVNSNLLVCLFVCLLPVRHEIKTFSQEKYRIDKEKLQPVANGFKGTVCKLT